MSSNGTFAQSFPMTKGGPRVYYHNSQMVTIIHTNKQTDDVTCVPLGGGKPFVTKAWLVKPEEGVVKYSCSQ